MRFRFRVALIVLLVGLLVVTTATVGICSYVNSRASARELADQVLDQTSLRIEKQIEKLLGDATASASLTVRLLESGQLRSNDFPGIVRYWEDVMQVHPEVTSFFIGLESTGECVGVSRLQGNKLSVWQTTRKPGADALELHEAAAEDYPANLDKPATARPGPDVRPRPWFVAAKQSAGPIWTDTYVFLGVSGAQDVLGLTHAVPVYRDGHTLDSVVMADFDLGNLSRFLQGVHVGTDGFAFLVELRPDGTRHVIAHPHPEILVGAERSGPQGGKQLVRAEDLADARVGAFLSRLPAATAPEGLQGSGSVRFNIEGKEFLGSYRRIQGDQSPRWLICTMLPEEDVMGRVHQANRVTLGITVAALALAIAMSIWISRQVARPLEYLARDAEEVGHLRLESRRAPRSRVLEVDRLAAASEEMKAGLRSFQKYVPADLVRGLLDSGQEARLGGERRTVTILFSDIAGFTSTSESMDSERLVAHLGDYLGAVSDQIAGNGGTVDKYIGDAVMAFWGAPAADPRHATSACLAAWLIQARLAALRPQWESAGKPACHTRIGIHTGEVIVGNIGSAARMNFTVIGDAVNLASRLEGLNKHYRTEILISEQTYLEAKDAIVARPLDWVSVKGRAQGVLVYEMLGVPGSARPETGDSIQHYTQALHSYRQRKWDEAIDLFESVLQLRSDDGPSVEMISRCRGYLRTPPGEDWDGVHRMTLK